MRRGISLSRLRLKGGNRSFHCGFGVFLKAIATGHKKQRLAVCRPFAVGIETVFDHHVCGLAKPFKPAHLPVVNKGPIALNKGMAVVAAGRRSG